MKEEKIRGSRNIPQEIVEEILVKLPVKSLVRFKAVSRAWGGTIASKYFIEKHNRFQKSLGRGQARIVAISRETRYNGLALDNVLFSANGIVHGSPYPPIRSFNRFDGFEISEPCDGLFCLYTITRIFTLVNPATTSRRRLPDPTSTIADGAHKSYTLLGIGREDSVRGKYKLVWFFDYDNELVNKSLRCKVFALDSNTWRYVDPPHCRVHYDHPLIHLDGVIYCFSYHKEHRYRDEQDVKLLAFDLHTQKFQRLQITPDILFRRYCDLSMRVLNHRLCISKGFVDDNVDHFFKIWGLEINKRSWEMMYSIDLSCFPPEFKQRRIIPMATINNYLIISNYRRNIWLLYNSKSSILHGTDSYSDKDVMSQSYCETLVSAYQ
ncbi:PREDICTED: putative F-box protein At2g02030 [Camelina sativa]|uniref:F-box protein At2g02030 n=1 Tax=Camelina sativa TaxID=90675 RepID=A0ABM0VXU1_CAMSA|nr:PREDICTED: putative F-box protein At2g02030 [Camelina sativa]